MDKLSGADQCVVEHQNTAAVFRNPGVLYYAFMRRPYLDGEGTGSDQKVLDDALAQKLVDLWPPDSFTSIDKRYAEVVKNAAYKSTHDKLCTAQELRNRLETYRVCPVLAAAKLKREGNHNTTVQVAHDALIYRAVSCDNSERDDLTRNVSEWTAAWEELFKLPELFGAVRVFFTEFSLLPDPENVRGSQEFIDWITYVRTKFGLTTYSPVITKTVDGFYLCRGEPVKQKGRTSFADTWILGFPHSLGRGVIERFVMSRDGLSLPAMAEYMLAGMKIRCYEQQAKDRAITIKGHYLKLQNCLTNASAQLNGGDLSSVDSQIKKGSEEQIEFEANIGALNRLCTTIDLNSWTRSRLSKQLFSVKMTNGAIPDTDLRMSQRARIYVRGEVRYSRSLRFNSNMSLRYLRARQAALQEKQNQHMRDEQEEFANRIHLLEIFIVAVYGVELAKLYHELGSFAIVIAGACGGLAAAFIYGLGFRKNASRKTMSAVLLSCAILILIPLLIGLGLFHKQAGENPPGDKAQASKYVGQGKDAK